MVGEDYPSSERSPASITVLRIGGHRRLVSASAEIAIGDIDAVLKEAASLRTEVDGTPVPLPGDVIEDPRDRDPHLEFEER